MDFTGFVWSPQGHKEMICIWRDAPWTADEPLHKTCCGDHRRQVRSCMTRTVGPSSVLPRYVNARLSCYFQSSIT